MKYIITESQLKKIIDSEIDERSRTLANTRKKRIFPKSALMSNPDRFKEYDKEVKNIKEENLQDFCFSPDSPKGLQLVNIIKSDIDEMGLDSNDMKYVVQNTPEILSAKNKVAEILNPVLPNASKDELKKMIQDLKAMKRQKKQVTPQTQPTQVNEQGGALASWESVKLFLLGLPTGVFVAIGAWLILRLLRCHIYMGLGKIGRGCGLDIQKKFLVKLAELIFLDFKNLFTTDPILYNCK